MKRARRILSLMLCLLLVGSLTVTAFATEGDDNITYELTINNNNPGHTYEAYQIFTGKLAEVDGKQILSDIEWGSAIANPETLLSKINAQTGLSALHGATTAAALAEKMANNVTTDSETIDLFAEVVGTYIRENSAPCAGRSNGLADQKYTISGLSAGYYLVKDQDGTLNDKNDVYTKYIIRVLKTTEVTPKGDVPKVEKTINDTIDGTFTNIEDFDVNDTAYYKWEGTLPSNLKAYESYTYKFTDILPFGIKFLAIERIYIEGHDGNLVHSFYSKENGTAMPAGITLTQTTVKDINGKDVEKIELGFENLLTLYPNILATHKIIVKYSARVTRDALTAAAMTNKVTLDFSNNPNGTGTGRTPEDVAHAFTFQINVDKYDADDPTKKLANAEFVMYYERTENDTVVKYYAQVITEEMIEAKQEINGIMVDADDLGVVYGWTTDKTAASILDTDQDGALSVRGLDEGLYYLEETKAPGGYNLMETPVQIGIIPTYTETGNVVNVSVAYEVDSIAQPSNTVGVRNSAGSTLPSTGGIGTTLFYIVGGILFAVAVVLLVTKKRMRE